MPRLSQAVLSDLSANSNMGVPKYDPSALQAGIVHVGVGNFFRAHWASYLDQLVNKEAENGSDVDQKNSLKWGIVGGAVSNHTYTKKRKALLDQDMMYTLVERSGKGATPQVIAAMVDCLPYQEDHAPLRSKLLDPAIKIVSLTVTEGGYFLTDGHFDPENEEIKHDIANPDKPDTIFGLIVQALKERRSKHIAPFTVMSCDNVPKNGDIAKSVVIGLAKEIDSELASWIEENACFPNSMVDRITPSTTEEELKFIREKYNYKDQVPVFCEPFQQWVMEDKFVNNERPALEKVGVKFVEDVTPWEKMKLRILNGGHASMCYPAALLGLEYVHEAAQHESIGPFLDCLQRQEIIPVTDPVPNQDLEEYWETIQSRYENPTLQDSIDRNCQDGADRQPKFIVPPIAANLDQDHSVQGLALVSAMWCRYCQGTTESGDSIEPNDTIWDELTETANKAKDDPKTWLNMEAVYGDLGQDEKFKKAFADQLKIVNEEGVEAAMHQYMDKTQSQQSNKKLKS